MSGWIDIRVRKPTEADADKDGDVIQRHVDGSTGVFGWDSLGGVVAWMPIPEFVPLPDPPEGWRYVQDGEAFDKRAKFWLPCDKRWTTTGERNHYAETIHYIVPIAPPTPTYRPFASAAEFDAFATKPWRFDSDAESMRRPPAIYTDKHHNGETWNQSLATKIFCDGTPFGVKVEE